MKIYNSEFGYRSVHISIPILRLPILSNGILQPKIMTNHSKIRQMWKAKWENCSDEFDQLAKRLKDKDLELNITKKADKFKELYAKMVSKNDK